jgi:hypothetical protein
MPETIRVVSLCLTLPGRRGSFILQNFSRIPGRNALQEVTAETA